MTYDELVKLARQHTSTTFETVTGRRFRVGVTDQGVLFFTPESTGRGQSDGRRAHERFRERYNRSGSLRPADYVDVTRNASYLIGLILKAVG